MKKIVLSLASIAAIFALAGCGSNQASSTDSSAKATDQTTKTEPVTLKMAAAASLEYAFNEKLIPLFEKENPNVKVEGSYDASGKLQTQIEQGMDADIFFSAATKQMDNLEKEKLIAADTKTDLLENKLVLIVPKDNPDQIKSFNDLTKAKTLAIGDPASVPAGQYAQEALTNLKLWDSVSDHLSLGTNVTEVLNWVADGSAEAGLVYETDAKTNDQVKVVATAPQDSLKEPVVYPVAMVKKSQHEKQAKAFLEFLQTKKAKAIFADYGFTPNN